MAVVSVSYCATCISLNSSVGLFCGSRIDPMYEQLCEPFLDAGYAIVYPDYRLLDPSSCWDELFDVRDALDYLFSSRFAQDSGVQLDTQRICLAGFSAGCYLARIAAIHAIKAMQDKISLSCLLLYFGMGGDGLLDYWVQPNSTKKVIKPAHLAGTARALPECSSASYTPDLPTNELCAARSTVGDWHWASGDFLNLCCAQPGLSASLRALPHAQRLDAVLKHEPDLEDILPVAFLAKSNLAKEWPSTLLVHGTADPLVPIAESQTTESQLKKLGRPVKLHLVEGGNHNLDEDDRIAKGDTSLTEGKLAAFAESIAFVKSHLQ